MSIATQLAWQYIMYVKVHFVNIMLYDLMFNLGCEVVVAKVIQEEDEREDDVITKVRTQRLGQSAMYLHPLQLSQLLHESMNFPTYSSILYAVRSGHPGTVSSRSLRTVTLRSHGRPGGPGCQGKYKERRGQKGKMQREQ